MTVAPQWHIKNFDKFIEVRAEVIQNPNKHGKNQYVSPVGDEFKSKIQQLRDNGHSYDKIANELNTTRSAVSGIVYRERRKNRNGSGY